MKKNRTRLEIENMQNNRNKFLKDRQRILYMRKENLDTISYHTQEVSILKEAKSIAEKINKGEATSNEDKEKLKDIKKQYESFFEDEKATDMEALEDVISYNLDEKKSYIERDNDLKDKMKALSDNMKSGKSEGKSNNSTSEANSNNSPSEDKNDSSSTSENKKSSIVDDYADVSTQMPDFIDYD